MLFNYSLKSYKLFKNITLFYSNKSSTLFFKGLSGIYFLRLPSFYVQKNLSDEKKIIIKFFSNYFFKSFIKHSSVLFNRLTIVYFFKLRIRGLGFRLRSISNVLYYFFFNFTNFFYLYPPKGLLIRTYKKRMLLVSLNWFLLKLILSHILLLRKIGPYNFLGLRFKRQIILLKKSGKKV